MNGKGNRNLHEEITKTPLIRPSRANEIIEVRSEWDAIARCGNDVDAVALPVAVVAEVYTRVCALGDRDVGCWGGEGGGSEGEEDGGGELHRGIRRIV